MSTDPVADATGKNVSASGLFGQNKNVPIKSRFNTKDLAVQGSAVAEVVNGLSIERAPA